MRYTETTKDSAVSPVIGVILMVAITVILAAVIGTFVLGLGDATGSSGSAGVSIEQEAGESVTVKIVDTGNLDSLRVVGPDGSRSAPFFSDGILRTGLEIELRDGGFANSGSSERVTPAVEIDGSPMNLVNGGLADGAGPTYGSNGDVNIQRFDDIDGSSVTQDLDADLTLNGKDVSIDEECRVSAPGQLRGIDINGRPDGAPEAQGGTINADSNTNLQPDIGCSLRNLQGFLVDSEQSGSDEPILPSSSISDLTEKAESLNTGSPVPYTEGEYKLVGTVDGKENVFQTFTVEGE